MGSQLLSAIEFLAVHKPFVTGKLAEILFNSFLTTLTPGVPEGMHFPALRNESLAQTERSILQLVAEGHSNEQIAKRFHMNVKLVKALVDYAIEKGLIAR